MKKFVIPVQWIMFADVEIEADSLNEAIDIVNLQYPELPEGEYVDDSFEVNKELVYEMNNEQGYINNNYCERKD